MITFFLFSGPGLHANMKLNNNNDNNNSKDLYSALSKGIDALYSKHEQSFDHKWLWSKLCKFITIQQMNSAFSNYTV